jgi:DNA-binding transcriptional regulator GbsR (MarR family)
MTLATPESAREQFMAAMSTIAHFWGFPKAMGAIYGAIYLSPEPLSLDELVEHAGVSKGAVSTHVRSLERLQMVHRSVRLGDRKDYYTCESNLWAVVRNVLRQRRENEFDRALGAVQECLTQLRKSRSTGDLHARHAFYATRIEAMHSFFATLDGVVATILMLDDLRVSKVKKLLRPRERRRRKD